MNTEAKDKLKEITDKLSKGLEELFESDRYKKYLHTMSKFHNYSCSNTLLIAMQNPQATYVAGFNKWKELGRKVKKGEKGIKIIAPLSYKKSVSENTDKNTEDEISNEDNNLLIHDEETIVTGYKVVTVFDISQTEGRELPNIGVNSLAGDVENYDVFFDAILKTSPVDINFENIPGAAHGYYNLVEKKIVIDNNMSELQNMKTAIHEIAHAKLHDVDLYGTKEEMKNRPDRRTREVEAESIAYTVCEHYGIDTSDYSFGYIAGWSNGKELGELKGSLETIRSTAAEIIGSMDRHWEKLQKKQSKSLEILNDIHIVGEVERNAPQALTAPEHNRRKRQLRRR